MPFFYNLHQKVENGIGGVFESYGRFVSRHPWKVVVFIGIIDIGLGLGLLTLKLGSGIEQYLPTDSTASKDEKLVRGLFTVNTSENYYAQSIPDLGLYGEVFIELSSGGNILNHSYWKNLEKIKTYVEETEIQDIDGKKYKYQDLCARANGMCSVGGGIFFLPQFINDMNSGTINYPKYTFATGLVFLDLVVGGVTTSNGMIASASALRLRFNLQSENSELSKKWELAFIDRIAKYSDSVFVVKYSYSDSLNVELGKSVTGDISFFSITFTLMIVFSCLALMGSNCVDNRYYLGLAGILSTGLAIVSSLGLVSLCGVEFVDIVGVMPFLILGIGVDDMFILLSGLAHTASTDPIETRIGTTMKTSGIAVTITSITDVLAFCAGAASVFPTVRNFSLYTGCAILFCYFNYMTFYIGVMTINEKRVSKNWHWFTCCETKTKEEFLAKGKSKTMILCCAGAPRQSPSEVEGPIEKYPKKCIKKIVLFKYAKVVILILACGYLGVVIWGATQFREDLDLRDLVSSDSYFYDSYDTNHRLFSQSLFISLNLKSAVDYRRATTIDDINNLLKDVRDDKDISNDFYLSWFHSYMGSPVFDNSSNIKFVSGLKSFLASPHGNIFVNDVNINGTVITSSRFHVMSSSLTTSGEQAALMVRIRDIVKGSPLPVFAFSPTFIYFEQYVQIMPQTIQTLAICVTAVFLVTALFMPLPTLILLVTLSVAMIMVGVIGIMYFWDLTLSSITMIHIIMCIGFSVDFSTHICHAYVQADDPSRNKRVSTAIDRSGGPILNGALSSIIGILMLAFSKSFIFFSFFKVMFVVMILGTAQALLILPVILSLIGPHYEHDVQPDKREYSLANYKDGTPL